MTFMKGRSGNPRGRPRKAEREALDGKAAGLPEDLAGLSTEEKAGAVESLLWRWLRDAKADRDRGSLARELTGAIRVIGELRRELKAHADVNVLILQERIQERDAELEEMRRTNEAEVLAVVGGLVAFPEARRSVLASLARVRAMAEHRGPGYPAIAPLAGEEEAVRPQGALAEAGPAAAAVPLPTEKGEPAAERPAPAPADQRAGSGPEGQEGLRRMTADIGGGARSPLPPGMWRESGTPSARPRGGTDPYGDAGPLDSRD